MTKFLVLLSIPLLACNGFTENNPVVTLPLGKVIGSRSNDGYYEFHNIPYAEPPIGKHRFEPPIPYEQHWDDELDGTQPMISCISFDKFAPPSGTEDCLYLHVVTPDIVCPATQLYPVRIQIHGGAYVMGSPNQVESALLAKHGMIIVTMGYRLGPLGFLSTGDNVISGNNGLKDQRLAIMWVKANIRNFCGDENNILLAGASAGGAASHMHLLQKSTENYVNAIATHNGVASCPWSLEPDPVYISRAFADLLHCPDTSDSESIKTCLQGKTINELRESTFALQYYENNPFTVFSPVVESPDSEDPFLTQHPREIMRNGQTANVTWLIGFTEREGSFNSAAFLRLNQANGNVAEIEILNKRWEELAPILLFFNRSMSSAERMNYSRYLKDRYLGEKKFSEENYRLLENMYTDVLFNNDIREAIYLHRMFCPGKVYAYYYRYPHQFGIGYALSQRKDIDFGADHTADTLFIIPRTHVKPIVYTDRDIKVSNKLLDMYIDWAYNGVLKFGGKNLPLSTPTDDTIMILNENCYSVDCKLQDLDSDCECYHYDEKQ